ncbi:MAG: hypothetical protein NC388_01515 [Clostridium sp.]|nr:hypothetical protein [Clostridium sp.]
MKKTFLTLACALSLMARAEVKLPAYYTDNMVLQQQSSLVIQGTARSGKTVTVTTGWDGKQAKVKADAKGNWQVTVQTPVAGGPYELSFSDGKRLTLRNVMVGEVWFCSGQSNMEMPVEGWGNIKNHAEEVRNSSHPSIRLYQVKKNTSFIPAEHNEHNMGGWQECGPQTLPEFSAVAYFYARQLTEKLNVPVGVIDATWGGTPIESWMPSTALAGTYGFEERMKMLERVGYAADSIHSIHARERQAWVDGIQLGDKGMQGDKVAWASASLNDSEWAVMSIPQYWEKSELGTFDGIVWLRRHIEIPASMRGKELTLRLGVIDDEDITYFNGVEIARGSGFMTPRTYTVPAELTNADKAVITVRVSDFGGEGGIAGKQDEVWMSVKDGQDKVSLCGDWKYRVGFSLRGYAPVLSPDGSSYYSVLYNAMVNPLIDFPVSGVIWYQGCANVGQHEAYANMFPALISSWRDAWKRPDMPFYFVQLANWLPRQAVQPDSEWARLREAQTAALSLDGVGMAVAIDLGEADDIHYKNKQDVGLRLSLQALNKTYGRADIACDAPVLVSYVVKGNRMGIRFSGDIKVESPASGFIIAGSDHRFHLANIEVDKDMVWVSSTEVAHPVAVRYAWADNPDVPLYGTNGLPVAPFRTDTWDE